MPAHDADDFGDTKLAVLSWLTVLYLVLLWHQEESYGSVLVALATSYCSPLGPYTAWWYFYRLLVLLQAWKGLRQGSGTLITGEWWQLTRDTAAVAAVGFVVVDAIVQGWKRRMALSVGIRAGSHVGLPSRANRRVVDKRGNRTEMDGSPMLVGQAAVLNRSNGLETCQQEHGDDPTQTIVCSANAHSEVAGQEKDAHD
ncbi:hypothetical protein Tdes44962_MAKER03886 [Teratosphaeria destructans]|uniref:Uncharacterized protein n=1 Tax=Teratosphaeria destructans TaxID=418781 RepID=A0A9W7SNX4_9PEZI|nr:hypothetical protein Tdes44962_MAKER03886 [Teratosphaeria destructans]